MLENARDTVKVIQTYQSIHEKSEAGVRQATIQYTEWCRTSVGVRQGCIPSPDLFNLFISYYRFTKTGKTGKLLHYFSHRSLCEANNVTECVF